MGLYPDISTTWWSGKLAVENGCNSYFTDITDDSVRPHHGYIDKIERDQFGIACQYKRCANRNMADDALCYWPIYLMEYGLLDYTRPDRLGLITE